MLIIIIIIIIIINYLSTESEENLRLRPFHINQALARSVQQGQGLRFSCEDGTLFALFLWVLNWPVGIMGE